jgi:hypothetical protein
MMSLFREILGVLKLALQWLIGPGEKVKWEKEYKRLMYEFDTKRKEYGDSLAFGDYVASHRAYNEWLSASTALNKHRLAGQRQGFLARS